MNEDKKREVHPIVKKALEIAYQKSSIVNFDDYAIEQLQEMLKQLFGKEELLRAVIDLINLARILDEQGSHSASMKLMVIVSTAGDALKALNEKTNKGEEYEETNRIIWKFLQEHLS